MTDPVRWFASRFRALGDPTRARSEKAYMKSALRFHGVTMPQLRKTSLEFCREHRDLDRSELRALADALYATDWFDLRSAAVAVLERRADLLGPADADWLIDLVRRSGCWAQVDWLSTQILGRLVEAEPKLHKKLRRWARDHDFWVRRASLLALLLPLRKGAGEFALFEELAAPMLEEKEFFIRKAIGWVLRETSKKDPDRVFAFLERHRARLSGLTLREGSRQLPSRLRARL